jgi:hypothetical protein
MSVRAKFRVDSIESTLSTKQNPDSKEWEKVELKTIKLNPVYSSDPETENHRFWTNSPSGHLSLGCINPEASSQFELGAEYYLDFTKAE